MNNLTLRTFDLWFGICVVGAVVYVGLLGYDYFVVSRINDLLSAYQWGQVPQQLIPSYNTILITVLYYSAYIMWGIGFFGTIIKARDTAQVLGVDGHTWSAWAIASLIVPIAGLIIPWLVVGEIRRSIIYSARHSSFDHTWRTKSRFSTTTLLVAISVLLNVGAIKVWGENGQHATSAQSVASAFSDMPLDITVISGCFAVSLMYLLTTRVFLLALIRRRKHSLPLPAMLPKPAPEAEISSPSPTLQPGDQIARMSLSEIISLFQQGGMNWGMLIAASKRLLEIAYFEYGIDLQDRERAANIWRAMLRDAERMLVEQRGEEGRASFKALVASEEKRIATCGYGSLMFAITDRRPDGTPIMSPERVVPTLSDPAVAHLLPNFFPCMEEKESLVRASILRHLIETHPSSVMNAVARAYGLANGRSHATLRATLPPEEFAALRSAPANYHDARKVLVTHGLLSQMDDKPFTRSLDDETLIGFVLQTTGMLQKAAEPVNESEFPTPVDALTKEEREAIKSSIMLLRFSICFEVIGDAYGSGRGFRLRKLTLARLEESGRAMDALLDQFDLIEQRSQGHEKMPMDACMASGLSNHLPEYADQDAFVRLITVWADTLNFERIRQLDKTRFFLRGMEAGMPEDFGKSYGLADIMNSA